MTPIPSPLEPEAGDEVTRHVGGQATGAIPPILGAGDRIESPPCLVTIDSRQGGLAFGWCGPCDAAHIIDAEQFDNGDGPWRRSTVPNECCRHHNANCADIEEACCMSCPTHDTTPTTWLDTDEAAALGQADLDRMAAEEARDNATSPSPAASPPPTTGDPDTGGRQ